MSRVRTLMLVAALALGSAAPAAAQTKILMNLFIPGNHPLNAKIVKPWAQEIEKRTGGRVKFSYPAKSLAPPQEQWEMVVSGIADGAYQFNGFAPPELTEVSHLPWSSTTSEAMSVALWRTYKKYFEAAGEYDAVKLLALFVFPPAEMYSLKEPITSIDDLQAMKMWGLPGNVAAMLDAAGAAVVSGPAVRMYEIVARGTVDGFAGVSAYTANAIGALPLAKSYTVLPGHIYAPSFSLFISRAKWDSLSEKDRKIVMDVSGEAFARRLAVYGSANRKALEQAVAKGLKRIEPPAAFIDELKRRWQFVVDKWIKEAKSKGVDGEAALLYFREQARVAAAGK